MDENKRDLPRDYHLTFSRRQELEELVANKLLESADDRDLAQVFWDMQKEWTETLTDEQLLETAKDLNIQEEV